MNAPIPLVAGRAVDVAAMEEELRRLWRDTGEGGGGRGMMRACVLNLIIMSEKAWVQEGSHGSPDVEPDDRELTALVAAITSEHPCRVIRVDARPQAPSSHLQAFLSAFCRRPAGSERQVCCEQITLMAAGEAAIHLHGTLAALLAEDLPVFLWWRGRPPFGSHRLGRLADLADRLILDTASVGDDLETLVDLAAWSGGAGDGAAAGDLAWRRLTHWREATAALFDPPAQRPLLTAVRGLDLRWNAAAGHPGRGQALYLAGWLAARLGWRTRPATVHATGDDLSLEMDAGTHVVKVRVQRGEEGDPSLSLAMGAHEHPPATARIGPGEAPWAELSLPGQPLWRWPGQPGVTGTAALLARELEFPQADPVFATALARAGELAKLWRRLGSGGNSGRRP
ncbi:MAG: glucose-6-phosphate dehydrogenase assembly protein OpcA [Acidobacteria bacterium]|nr:glucose-6-phosphate dehydrogenase assembly protein OpcA [Acidobacteriota bacterium]